MKSARHSSIFLRSRGFSTFHAWSPPVEAKVPSHILKHATVYQSENTLLSSDHLKKLCLATGKSPMEHIAYTPTRMAWQQTIFHTNTHVQFETPKEFHEKVEILYHQHVTPALEELEQTLRQHYADTFAQTEVRVAHLKAHKGAPRGSLWNNFALLKNRREKGEVILNNQAYFDRVLITMSAHEVYNATARAITDRLLLPLLHQGIAAKGFSLLPTFPTGNKVLLVHGAPGTGKSVAWKQFRKQLEKSGVSWSDVQKINADWYRPLLLRKNDLPAESQLYYEHLTNDELCGMTAVLFNQYITQPDMPNPHAIIEHPFPSEMMTYKASRANYGGKPCHSDVKMVFMVAPPDEVVQRVFSRAECGNPCTGMGKGRYATVADILARYRNALEELVPALLVAKQNNVAFEIIDKNVPLGAACPTIATGDFKTGVLRIMDVEGLLRMPRYGRINKSASSPEALYFGYDKEQPDLGWFFTLKDLMGTVEFVDQETLHTYAILHKGKCTVSDEALLKEKSQNPYYAAMFEHVTRVQTYASRLEQERKEQRNNGITV